MSDTATLAELRKAQAAVKRTSDAATKALERRAALIVQLRGQGVMPKELAKATGLTPLRVHQLMANARKGAGR